MKAESTPSPRWRTSERALIDDYRRLARGQRDGVRMLARAQVIGIDALIAEHQEDAPRAVTSDVALPARTIALRLVGDIAAGPLWDSERQGEEIDVDVDKLPRGADSSRFAVVRVAGDSMEPTLVRGALAIVRQCAIGDYRRGDIVIATIKGEVTMKRYAGQKKGVITLTADNPAHNAIVANSADVTIGAIVVGAL